MDKDIKLYFKKMKKKGASRAALIADMLGLRIAVFMAAYFAFFFLLKNFILPLFLAGIATFALSFVLSHIENASLERFIAKKTKEIKRALCLEKLLLCGKKRRMRFLENFIKKEFNEQYLFRTQNGFVSDMTYYHIFEDHPSCDIDANGMFVLYEKLLKTKKQRCVAICFSSFKDEAKEFMRMASSFEFELCDAETLFSIKASLLALITEEEVFAYIKHKAEESRIKLSDLRKEVLSSKKFKAYIITGTALGSLAFLSPFPAYFISMAAFCIFLGIFSSFSKDEGGL